MAGIYIDCMVHQCINIEENYLQKFVMHQLFESPDIPTSYQEEEILVNKYFTKSCIHSLGNREKTSRIFTLHSS